MPACQVISDGSQPQGGDGVGETRAVQMHEQAVGPRDGADVPDLVDRIDRAAFGHLGDGDGGGFHDMGQPGPAPADFTDRRFQRRRRHLAVGGGNRDQLGAVGVEFRRAALVFVGMAVLQAIDRVERLRDEAEAQRVGCRAGGDGIDDRLRVEQFGKPRVQPAGHVVAAIGPGALRPVCLGDRFHDFRGDAGDIVRSEIDRREIRRFGRVECFGRRSRPECRFFHRVRLLAALRYLRPWGPVT